jgi:uncharacterized protein (DUF736 family)
MEIGAGFVNYNVEKGTENISIVLDEAVKEIFPQLKEVRISLIENKNKGDNEKAPAYRVTLFKPKES